MHKSLWGFMVAMSIFYTYYNTITIKHIINFIIKYISKGAIDMKFSPKGF